MRVDERDEMMLPTNSATTLASAPLVIPCGGPSGANDFRASSSSGDTRSSTGGTRDTGPTGGRASGGAYPALGGLSGGLGSGGRTPSEGGAPPAGSAGTIAAGGNQAMGGKASAADASGSSTPKDCGTLPPVSDYAAKGPFADAKMFTNTGPNGSCTVFRPDVSLGKDGFRHPIAAWGNGISATPDQYTQTLTLIATHGFVIVDCNDTQVERPCMSAGLDWLITQDASGPMMSKLDISREAMIGYSWGGGAAIDTSDRVNVKATVSLHGMPPRVTDAFEKMHAPLLLFTSTGDTFVSAEGYVTPNFEKALVQTFYATLADANADHVCAVDAAAQRMEVTPPIRHGGGLFAELQGDA